MFAVGNAARTLTQEGAESGVGESGWASSAIHSGFPKHVSEEVLIHSTTERATAPTFRAVVDDVRRRLAAVPYSKAFRKSLRSRERGSDLARRARH